jgi:hypothetical protein
MYPILNCQFNKIENIALSMNEEQAEETFWREIGVIYHDLEEATRIIEGLIGE